MSNKHPALHILEDLIRIQSVNPQFGDDAEGEGKLSEYVERRMKQAGLSVTRQSVFPGRDNLIVELRVGKPEAMLLFESHMDTVTLGTMENPLTPIYREGRLYGRGACDSKATLAGMMYALEQCAKNRDRLNADVVLCAAVDEEHAYRGILRFLDLDLPIARAVVGEPTDLRIVAATKGCSRFAVRTQGKAAHTSVPQEGNNAIYQMMQVVRYLHEEVEPRLTRQHHPLCGSPTLAVGMIYGGKQINIVPEFCEIQVDRRIIPGEKPDEVLRGIEEELQRKLSLANVRFTIHELLSDWALNTPLDEPIIRHSQRTAQRLGLNSEVKGVPYGSDASKLQQLKGIPSIVYGPGSIAQAHSREEWVLVEDVIRAAEFYYRLAFTNGTEDMHMKG